MTTLSERITEAAAKIGLDRDEIRSLHSWCCDHHDELEARYVAALLEPILEQYAAAENKFRAIAALARSES